VSSIQDPFARLTLALEPWLDRVIVIGGCAHRLYRFHPAAQELDFQPLVTLDTDIAVPLNLAAGEQDIRARLLAHDFTEEFIGDRQPPAAHYRLGDADSGFYAEFLAPLTGGEYDRRGKRKATAVIAGVNVQKLRYIEILLHQPWAVDFVSDTTTTKIQVANPVSFIAQKILVHDKRSREDRAKDILYVHDTLELFGARLHELHDLWRDVVAPRLHAGSVKTVSRASQDLFGSITDDVRRAATVADARALSAEAVRETCQYGLTRVFGEPRGRKDLRA
jgi:hypothetical protein